MTFARHYFPDAYFPGRYFPPLEDAESGASLITTHTTYYGSTRAGSWDDAFDFNPPQPQPQLLIDEAEALTLALLASL